MSEEQSTEDLLKEADDMIGWQIGQPVESQLQQMVYKLHERLARYHGELSSSGLRASELLEELRSKGWSVVCHNDYIIVTDSGRKIPMTRWSFSKNDRFIKGEGLTDEAALQQCMRAALRVEGMP